MSDFVWPHRWQPTRLPRPWDSPGKKEHWSGLPFPSPMHESKKWVKSLSRVPLLATLWTAAYQAPPSMGFSRQEYWSGVPLPSLIYTHVSTLFQILFPFSLLQNWSEFLVLLVIYLKCSNVYMSIPNFQSIPSPQPHTGSLSLWVLEITGNQMWR